MALLMIPALVLFLIDKKWAKVALICIAVCAAAAFAALSVMNGTAGRTMSISDTAFFAGMILIGISPVVERIALHTGLLSGAADDGSAHGKDSRAAGLADEEDDIVNNRQKWRLIIAGYVILILFSIVMLISVIRLNAKINTLYGFSQDLDKRIESLE